SRRIRRRASSFAEVFSIPLGLFGLACARAESSLTGAASPSSASLDATVSGKTAWEGGDDSVRRRRALTGLVGVTGATLLGIPDHAGGRDDSMLRLLSSAPAATAAHLSVQELRGALAAARSLFQRCRYADLADTLPDLILTTQLSREEAVDHQYEELSALLADAYSLASELCTRLHDYPLAWVTADRARFAAQASGHAVSVAEAARMASIAMRKHGHHDAAITLLTTTALNLSAATGSPQPDLLGTYGSLLCTAAYTAAQHGSRTHALELISASVTKHSKPPNTSRPRNYAAPRFDRWSPRCFRPPVRRHQNYELSPPEANPVHSLTVNHQVRTAEFLILLASQARGRGLATEATRLTSTTPSTGADAGS
ncbi:MAG: hypothetical protein ACRDTT_21710, partial [Pseudonocardiaceae bacterium]